MVRIHQALFIAFAGTIAAGSGIAPARTETNPKPLDTHLFHTLRRISSPVVSPDQSRALYTTSRYDPELNKEFSYLCLLDIASGSRTQLTPELLDGERISNPIWLGQGTAGYLAAGSLYQHGLSEQTNGTLLFNATVSIASVVYRPATKSLFFTAGVYPDGNISQMHEHVEKEKKRSDSAQVFDNLWARHWNKWMTITKTNLFAIPLDATESGNVAVGALGQEVNLMQKLAPIKDPLIRWNTEWYAVSDNGKYAAFVVRSPSLDMVWKTNVDIYMVATDGKSDPRLLTGRWEGAASSPAFSPDNRFLAWLQMETPGYESDINRIYIYDTKTGNARSIARTWTLSPQSILWSANSQQLHVLALDRGDRKLFSVNVHSGRVAEMSGYGHISTVARVGSDRLLALYSNVTESSNIQVLDIASANRNNNSSMAFMRRLTDINADRLQDVYLSEAEDFWFTGARNESVHGWLLRPFDFDEKKKYPMALLIHGGPQQGSSHSFGLSQWNPNMYASAGFVAVVINFHGSSGYGQNFTDSITEQWGGHPYKDLMNGVDYLLQKHAFIDSKRLVALGASYGGYMVNWINANSDRFAALVAHDGQFNVVSGYYTTDELWFVEHDVGGVPFTSMGRAKYDAYNPERLADKFKTPTLFVHGANDFRLTLEQSIAPWTLLRRKGIPARLVYFPDEDHWTNKPGNSVRWYNEVLAWIAQWTK
ncbi:dipeptidylpeptidase [Coemansia sp. RSA 1722]|nr:dipeptidylpeptidase [Coemansia sp. RSA 486]KAJ2232586.1 Dipeptidyl-peptidase 5 [Coemansia sp. RSA 485]KAJ2604355.1 dipeptidylpeptidase [Coemansia sp. RSA 1722]